MTRGKPSNGGEKLPFSNVVDLASWVARSPPVSQQLKRNALPMLDTACISASVDDDAPQPSFNLALARIEGSQSPNGTFEGILSEILGAG